MREQAPFRILFMSREGAESFNTDEPHIVISITDPGSRPARLPFCMGRLDVLRLSFHDVDRPLSEYGLVGDERTAKRIILFDALMAEQIGAFVRCHMKHISLVVVHCEAGISRSAGVAAALSKALMGNDESYFRRAIPNRLVYRLTLDAMMGWMTT